MDEDPISAPDGVPASRAQTRETPLSVVKRPGLAYRIRNWFSLSTNRYKVLTSFLVVGSFLLLLAGLVRLLAISHQPESLLTKLGQASELAWGLLASLLASMLVLWVWERQHEGPSERAAAFRRFFGIREPRPLRILFVFCTRKLKTGEDDCLRSYIENQYVESAEGGGPRAAEDDVPAAFQDYHTTLKLLRAISDHPRHRHGVDDWLALDDVWAARPLISELERLAGASVEIELVTDEDFFGRLKAAEPKWHLTDNVITFGLGFNWATLFLTRQAFGIRYPEVKVDGVDVIKNAICIGGEEEVSVQLDPINATAPAAVKAGLPGYAVISRLHRDRKIVFIIAGRDAEGTQAAGRFLAKYWHQFVVAQRPEYPDFDQMLERFDLRLVLKQHSGKWLLDAEERGNCPALSAFFRGATVRPVQPLPPGCALPVETKIAT
ncbi:MAG: hypothetical protein ACLQGV_00355 [Bryobacteraceae bacterium]